MKKIITLLLILILAGGSYVFWNKDIPVGTNTYSSSLYKYSFEYPNGYYKKENPNEDTLANNQSSIVLVEDTEINRDIVEGRGPVGTEGPVSITIETYTNEENLPVDEWLTKTNNWIKAFPQTPREVRVDGIKAFEYIWDGLYSGKSVIVVNNKVTYIFSVTWMNTEDKIIEDFDRILRTVDLK